jgi:hypothetical protein
MASHQLAALRCGLVCALTTAQFCSVPAQNIDRASADLSPVAVEAPVGGATLVISTNARVAGAVDSIIWKGREFVNSFDHGRQFQSAVFLDGQGECLNPTEAGSRNDGQGPTSTSQLLYAHVKEHTLETRTRMAYWLGPGQTSPACPKNAVAATATALSDYEIEKRVTIGVSNVENAIEYKATYHFPRAHNHAVFEVVSAHLPPEFSEFWVINLESGELQRLPEGNEEQNRPIIISTPDEQFALGVYSPELPQRSWPMRGYGQRRNFGDRVGQSTTKWNCVFRKNGPSAGPHTFRCFAAIGTLPDVKNAILDLRRLYPNQP